MSTTTATLEPPDLKHTRRSKPSNNGNGFIDRLPPHSPECEAGLIGCMMLSPVEVIPQAVEKLKGGAECFYDLRHQTIYQTLCELADDQTPIDIISLQQRLKDWGTLEQVGGLAYLSTLPDTVPSAANWEYYLETVREKFLLRTAVRMGADIVSRTYDFEGDADELLDSIERDMLTLSQSRVVENSRDTPQLVRSSIQHIEDMHQRQGAISGLTSGFCDLDRMIDGFQNAKVYTIAGRPSLGKTSLAMNIAEHVAVDLHLPVGVFSIEMTAESLITRMICARAHVNLRNVREGFLAERDFPRLTGAAGAISRAPLYIDDTSAIPLMQLRAKARRMKQQHNIRLLIIDYLQLITSGGQRRKDMTREQEVAHISAGVKSLAKELLIPIVLLAQLNRQIERDKKRKPQLSDLRESGSIEQDSDFVGMLYKPTRYNDDEPEPPENDEALPVNLAITKQRDGPTGDVELTFLKPYTRFESAARISDEDVPEARERQQPELPNPPYADP